MSTVAPRVYWRTDAVFSPCSWGCGVCEDHCDGRLYRYRLSRHWSDGDRMCCFCMVNPSTATATMPDPTITRCVDYAQRWGFDGLIVVNCFALRSPFPISLLERSDPIGPDNDAHIREVAASAARVVMAWGSKKSPKKLYELVQGRGRAVEAMLRPIARELGHLGRNDDQSPRHPLFLPKDTSFVPVVRP